MALHGSVSLGAPKNGGGFAIFSLEKLLMDCVGYPTN